MSERVESARQWVSRLRCAARRQLRALGCARRAGARASAQGSIRRWGQHDRWERVRHRRPLGTSSRRRRTCGETSGTAGRRAGGSPPAPAASAQADATQRAAGVVSFGCAQGGVVSARAKLSTRWGCGQRGSVLPTVALRGTGGRATSSLDSRDYTQPTAATTSSSNRLQTLYIRCILPQLSWCMPLHVMSPFVHHLI